MVDTWQSELGGCLINTVFLKQLHVLKLACTWYPSPCRKPLDLIEHHCVCGVHTLNPSTPQCSRILDTRRKRLKWWFLVSLSHFCVGELCDFGKSFFISLIPRDLVHKIKIIIPNFREMEALESHQSSWQCSDSENVSSCFVKMVFLCLCYSCYQ